MAISELQEKPKVRGKPLPPLPPLVIGPSNSHNSTTASNTNIMTEHVPFQIVTRAARRKSIHAVLGEQGLQGQEGRQGQQAQHAQQVQHVQQAQPAQQQGLKTRKTQHNHATDNPKPGRGQPPRKRRKATKRKTAERSPGHSDSTISLDGDEDDTYLYKFGEGPGRSHASAPRSLGRRTKISDALTRHSPEEGAEASDAGFHRHSRVNMDVSDQSSPSPMKRAAHPVGPMGQINYRENDVEDGYCDLFHSKNFDRNHPTDHHPLPAPQYERADSQETVALPEEYFQSSEADNNNNFPEDPRDPHSTENLAKELDYSVQAAINRANLKAILRSRPQAKYDLTEELADENPVNFSQVDWDQHVKEHERY